MKIRFSTLPLRTGLRIALVAILGGLFSLPQGLEARVGENRQQLENRLLRQERTGIEVRDRQLLDFYQSRVPLGNWASVLENRVEYVLYFKHNRDTIPSTGALWETVRNDRRPVRQPDGWLFHVFYMRGISVLEFYEKGAPLTPVERDGLLSLYSGSVNWKRGNPREDNIDPPGTLPVNAYLADGSLFAQISPNHIMVYHPEFDSLLTAEIRRQQEEEAPNSLRGF